MTMRLGSEEICKAKDSVRLAVLPKTPQGMRTVKNPARLAVPRY
jgi:hypothetical protein